MSKVIIEGNNVILYIKVKNWVKHRQHIDFSPLLKLDVMKLERVEVRLMQIPKKMSNRDLSLIKTCAQNKFLNEVDRLRAAIQIMKDHE